MDISNILLILTILSGLAAVISALLITGVLQKREIPVNWLFVRPLIFKYIGQYREITRKETGKTGPLFYFYVICMNVALIAGILALLTR